MKKIIAKVMEQVKKALGRFGINATDKQLKSWLSVVYRRLLFWTPIFLVYAFVLIAAMLLNLFKDPVAIFDEKYGAGTIVL